MSASAGFMSWIWGKQEFVQQAVEQLPDGIYASDLDSGRWAYLNHAMATITGFSIEESYSMGVEGFRARIHPDDQERNLAGIRRLLEQGGPETLEYRWLHQDGHYRWLSNTRTVLPAGEAHILVGTVRDISEQKETETALRESAERFRTIHEASPDGLMILNAVRDERGQIVDLTWEYLNPVAERLNQTTTVERRGQRMLQLYTSPADREFFQRYVRVIETSQPQETEVHYQGAGIDGWFRNVAVKVGDGVAVLFEDITERKQAEQALRESEERFRSLFENSIDALLLTRPDGSILDANPAAERMLGWSREELRELGRSAVVDTSDPRLAEGLRVRAATGRFRGELTFRRKDGTTFPVEISTAIFRDLRGHEFTSMVIRDITERARAKAERERLLAEIERRAAELEAVFQALPDLYFRLDSDGTILASYAQFPEYLYVPREKFMGKRMTEILPPDVGQQIWEALRTVLHTRSLVTFEYSLTMSGREQVYEGRMVPLKGEQVVLIARNITERKRAEEALRESEERFRVLFEQAAVGIKLVSLDGQLLEAANQKMANILGYTREELAGRPIAELTLPEDWQREKVLLERLMAGEIPSYVLEKRYLRKDGQLVWARVTTSLIQSAHLAYRISLVMAEDVTARKQAEQALRESEERFRALVTVSSQVIYQMSPDWSEMRQLHSRGFLANTETSNPNWLQEYIPPKEQPRVTAAIQEAIRTKSVFDLEHRIWQRDGSIGWTHSRAIPVLDAEGNITEWFGSADDLTERKQAEEALQKSQEQLRALNETLEQQVIERTARLRGLSLELTRTEERERRRLAQLLHDHLQQLLAAARISLNMVRSRMENEHQAEALGQVDELLDESIAESRSLTAELSPPVLYDAGLAPSLDWLARWMEEKYHLHVEVQAEDLGIEVPEEIRLVLFQGARELLFNVVKHAGVDQARIELRRLPDDQLELVISDQGVGVDPAQIGKQQTQTGFGLFNVRERLESLGGRMHLDSAPGQGTRVTLRVPLRPEEAVEEETARTAAVAREVATIAAEELAAEREEAERAAAAGVQAVRVLLADDHVIMRQGLARLLEDEPGIELVGQANDGREAVELAHVTRPDIVLMDVSMPVMDGIEATRRIAAELPDVQVIGLSMYADPEVAQRMRDAGAVDHIPKGGDPTELVEAVRKWGKR